MFIGVSLMVLLVSPKKSCKQGSVPVHCPYTEKTVGVAKVLLGIVRIGPTVALFASTRVHAIVDAVSFLSDESCMLMSPH